MGSLCSVELLDMDYERWIVEQRFEFGDGMGTDLETHSHIQRNTISVVGKRDLLMGESDALEV